ncbi:hypothetical protein WJX82_000475 [Trebouxia sp. C0006]
MTTVAVPPTASSWPGLEKFNLVQDYLEKNKLLITEINNNHEIRSSEGLARNVYLIRELNNNVAKTASVHHNRCRQLARWLPWQLDIMSLSWRLCPLAMAY